MKRKPFIFENLSILLLLSIFSCNKVSESNISLVTMPNDSINGQAFIGESSKSVSYSPKGKFIQLTEPNSGIWSNLIIQKSNQEIKSKVFFDDNDNRLTKIFDSLKVGNYDLKYISDLNDTVVKKIKFVNSIKLMFPKSLNEFYIEKSIEEFDFNNFKVNDTLQLIYRNFGCFGGSITNIEFTKVNDRIIFRKKIVGQTNENEPQNEWIYAKKNDVEKKLNEFINSLKQIDINGGNYCSSQVDYIFRINDSKKIYWSKDKACQFIDEISELLSVE